MWHKIWDTAVGFHKRYIRPVWSHAPYSKLKEICDESEVEMSTTGVYCASVTDTSISNEPINVNRFENKTLNSSVSTMSIKQGYDEVDTGISRSNIYKMSGSSPTVSHNSKITNLKHALPFPAKKPSYQHVQEEAEKIEELSAECQETCETTRLNSGKRKSYDGYQSVNLECTETSEHKGSSDYNKQCQTSPSVEVTVEEIIPSSTKNEKKFRSRRRKIQRKIKRALIILWRHFKTGISVCALSNRNGLAFPIFYVYPDSQQQMYCLG